MQRIKLFQLLETSHMQRTKGWQRLQERPRRRWAGKPSTTCIYFHSKIIALSFRTTLWSNPAPPNQRVQVQELCHPKVHLRMCTVSLFFFSKVAKVQCIVRPKTRLFVQSVRFVVYLLKNGELPLLQTTRHLIMAIAARVPAQNNKTNVVLIWIVPFIWPKSYYCLALHICIYIGVFQACS